MNHSNILRIAICDDSEADLSATLALVKYYMAPSQIQYSVTCFHNGNELISSKDFFDILFLDVELGDSNGIELMHRLEKCVKVWRLIITTSHAHYIVDSFGIRTAGFLHKPIKNLDFKHCLDKVLSDYSLCQNNYFEFDHDHYLPLRDVLYLKGVRSYVYVYTSKEHIVISGNLPALMKRINSPMFFQIGKGCIVNIANVTNITRTEVFLGKDIVLPIGEAYEDEFRNAVAIYLRDNQDLGAYSRTDQYRQP